MRKFSAFLVAFFTFWIFAMPEIGLAQQSSCRQQGSRQVTLRSSAALITTTSGSTLGQLQDCKEAVFILDVTVVSNAATDFLYVYIQSSPDGTNWLDVARFANITNATAQRVARWSSRVTVSGTNVDEALSSSAMAAGTVSQGPQGRLWRTRAVLSAAATASWTYSVVGYFRD